MPNICFMRIEQSLTELLYRYQCVTIPAFGAFLTETIPAQYILSTQTFSPPRKIIYFNLHIKNNDGLLANHLAQKESVTYDVALRFIEIVVDEWKQILYRNRVIEFDKIGKIELSSENNLVFTPFDNTNFDLNSFGLSPIQSKSVFRVVDKNIPVFNISNEASNENELEINNVVSNQGSQKSKEWIRYAASFVAFVSLTGAGYGYFFKQNIEKQTKIVAQKVQTQVEQKIQEATFFIENPLPAITVTLASPKLNYHIVGGAFKTYENAEKLVRDLEKEGFSAKIGEINQYGLYPVYYASFETNEEALINLNQIKTSINKDAWILFLE